jgi:hypothetical protein
VVSLAAHAPASAPSTSWSWENKGQPEATSGAPTANIFNFTRAPATPLFFNFARAPASSAFSGGQPSYAVAEFKPEACLPIPLLYIALQLGAWALGTRLALE